MRAFALLVRKLSYILRRLLSFIKFDVFSPWAVANSGTHLDNSCRIGQKQIRAYHDIFIAGAPPIYTKRAVFTGCPQRPPQAQPPSP